MRIGLKKEKLLWMAGEITLARRRIREAVFLMEHDEDREFFERCYHFEKSIFKNYDRFYLYEDKTFLDEVRSGDRDAIGEAILFLDVNPYCFRSGFIKKKLCRALMNAPLNREERWHLRQIVIEAINTQRPVSFKDFVSLGCRLYTPGFHLRIKRLKVIPFKYIINRKKYFLQRLEEASKTFVPPPPGKREPHPCPEEKKPLLKRIVTFLRGWLKQIARR